MRVKVGCRDIRILEEVRDVEEFIKLLHPESRVHYEIYWKPTRVTGLIEEIEAGIIIYGITREGFVLRCAINDRISWDSPELRKYDGNTLHERYNAWIKERWKEYEKIAKELGATPGKFEFAVIS